MAEQEKSKSIGQIILMAGVSVIGPILVFLSQYQALEGRVEAHEHRLERVEDHIDPTRDLHPPRDYRRLQRERDDRLKERLDDHERNTHR